MLCSVSGDSVLYAASTYHGSQKQKLLCKAVHVQKFKSKDKFSTCIK